MTIGESLASRRLLREHATQACQSVRVEGEGWEAPIPEEHGAFIPGPRDRLPGFVRLSAMSRMSAGTVEVCASGVTIYTDAANVQRAVDHAIAWYRDGREVLRRCGPKENP